MDECPEWDILIIMLERRNLSGTSSTSRIKKISVPFICPSDISGVISDLLKGKWATRPSNQQLSLAGNVDKVLNLDTPGCYMCHRALQVCNEPVKDNWDLGSSYDHDATLTCLREYPRSEDEVLDTWKARTVLWKDLNRDKGGRVFFCVSNRTHSPTKTIDADSY
ncbi:hypothetical protein CPB86DRAFT_737787 [Serendipita vermifera]|nr:hypothetical protein CPB86DRAFT_737787 [Serendipita vermifera]